MMQCLFRLKDGKVQRAAALFMAAQALLLFPALNLPQELAPVAVGLIFLFATLPLVVVAGHTAGGRHIGYLEALKKGIYYLLTFLAVYFFAYLLLGAFALLVPSFVFLVEYVTAVVMYAYSNVLLARLAESNSFSTFIRSIFQLKGMGVALVASFFVTILFANPSPTYMAAGVVVDGLLRAVVVSCSFRS